MCWTRETLVRPVCEEHLVVFIEGIYCKRSCPRLLYWSWRPLINEYYLHSHLDSTVTIGVMAQEKMSYTLSDEICSSTLPPNIIDFHIVNRSWTWVQISWSQRVRRSSTAPIWRDGGSEAIPGFKLTPQTIRSALKDINLFHIWRQSHRAKWRGRRLSSTGWRRRFLKETIDEELIMIFVKFWEFRRIEGK